MGAAGRQADRSASGGGPPPAAAGLKVSAYDNVAALLVALLILVGLCVLLLALILWTRMPVAAPEVVKLDLMDELADSGDRARGPEQDFEEPAVDELNEVEPELENLLSAVTDAVSTVQAVEGGRGERSPGGEGRGGGGSGGKGRQQPIWGFRYDSNLHEYARQLDFFGIELAAMGGGRNVIDYASGFSKPSPARRSGSPTEEHRRWQAWNQRRQQEIDRRFLARAGIETTGRAVVQFLPREVEIKLTQLQRAKAGNRKLEEIRKTVFGVRKSGTGYEFYVIEQTYRSA